jgi:hypothetical protein
MASFQSTPAQLERKKRDHTKTNCTLSVRPDLTLRSMQALPKKNRSYDFYQTTYGE